MAKIHVKGGSPLRLEFEDDAGNSLKVQLEEKKGTDEYYVNLKGTTTRLQAFRGKRKNYFTETNPTEKSCEISYKGEKAPVPATA